MKRRLFIQVNGLAVAALGLAACNNDSTGGASGGGGDGKHTIVIVPKDATNPWFVRMETGVKKFAEETGLNVYQKGPSETDATKIGRAHV